MRGPRRLDELTYEGPPHLTVRARPLALKRALTNLVANAVMYGGRRAGAAGAAGVGRAAGRCW